MVGDRRSANFGAWTDVEVSMVWQHYVEAISGAGGAPVVFPVDDCYVGDPELALDAVDGIVLTGGRDLEATSYGAQQNPENEPGDELRDRVELALAAAAVEADLPLLGVCRGMQLLNVALGGGIDQHLADPDGLHRGEPGAFVGHEVEAVAGSTLARIIGEAAVEVRSHHHQGVEPIADRLRVAGHSPDGLVEAVENPDARFCVAVLWHPEEDLPGGGAELYGALVAAADRRRAEVAA